MEFRLLGPLELSSGGQQHNLGPAKERCLLVILLLAAGTVVPVEDLIDRIWDANPPARAAENIPVYLSRLRKRLHRSVGDQVSLIARAHGYQLDIDPGSIDLHRFRLLWRQSRPVSQSGDPGHAADLLREAEGLWRGQALAGLPGDWIGRMRRSLEEERRTVILERIELDLALGRHTELLGELSRFRAQYPLDEAFAAQEMRALQLSGRRSDALLLYRQTRQRLIEEQGTEPGTALTELHQRMLTDAHDPAREPPRPEPPGPPVPDTLPPGPPEFVGRAHELHWLAEIHAAPHVAVIEGMPGVGKTALAVRAARSLDGRYPDGQLYLNLHAHDPGHEPLSSADALHRLLEMIAVPPAGIPRGDTDRSVLWRVELNRRRIVVVLDDVASAEQIRPILPEAGQSLVLITTRRRLAGLTTAAPLALDVLPAADAAALFTHGCGTDDPLDRDEVAEVTRLCGHLPLAIQLLAARFRQGYPSRLAELIEELSSPPVRHGQAGTAQAQLVSAFELSYRGLGQQQQRLFRRLGAQPCAAITTNAAAALAGFSAADAETAVSVLLNHHLLAQVADGHLRLHDLLRGYAAGLAAREDPSSEPRQAIGRLLDYYLHNADHGDRILYPHRRRRPVATGLTPPAAPVADTPERARQWLESEWRSMLQAARYAAEHEWQRRSADLIHVLAGFLETMAYWDEAIAAHTLALETARELADPLLIAQSLLDLSLVRQRTGLHQATRPLVETALRIYQAVGDQRGAAEALDRLGMAHYHESDYRVAIAYFREANDLYRRVADAHGTAVTLGHTSLASWLLGRHVSAVAHLNEALGLYQQLGDRRGEAKALNNLGDMQLRQGYHRDALHNYQRSRSIFEEIGGRWNLAVLYSNIGGIYQYKGDYQKALAEYRRSLAICREVGDLRHQAASLNDIGSALRCLDDCEQALGHHQQAAAMAEQIGDSGALVAAQRGMADAHRASRRYAQAQRHYLAAINLAQKIDDPHEEAKSLEGMAETVLQAKGAGPARIILRQALDLFEQIGDPEAEAVRIRIEILDEATTSASHDLDESALHPLNLEGTASDG